jgi:hypothetical protein
MSATETPPQPESPPQIERVCPACGNVLKREWRACPSCGWTMNKVSHTNTIASVVCCVVGWFVFQTFLGLIGIALAATAVSKDKDRWGYLALAFAILTVIVGIIVWIDAIINPYYYY